MQTHGRSKTEALSLSSFLDQPSRQFWGLLRGSKCMCILESPAVANEQSKNNAYWTRVYRWNEFRCATNVSTLSSRDNPFDLALFFVFSALTLTAFALDAFVAFADLLALVSLVLLAFAFFFFVSVFFCFFFAGFLLCKNVLRWICICIKVR